MNTNYKFVFFFLFPCMVFFQHMDHHHHQKQTISTDDLNNTNGDILYMESKSSTLLVSRGDNQVVQNDKENAAESRFFHRSLPSQLLGTIKWDDIAKYLANEYQKLCSQTSIDSSKMYILESISRYLVLSPYSFKGRSVQRIFLVQLLLTPQKAVDVNVEQTIKTYKDRTDSLEEMKRLSAWLIVKPQMPVKEGETALPAVRFDKRPKEIYHALRLYVFFLYLESLEIQRILSTAEKLVAERLKKAQPGVIQQIMLKTLEEFKLDRLAAVSLSQALKRGGGATDSTVFQNAQDCLMTHDIWREQWKLREMLVLRHYRINRQLIGTVEKFIQKYITKEAKKTPQRKQLLSLFAYDYDPKSGQVQKRKDAIKALYDNPLTDPLSKEWRSLFEEELRDAAPFTFTEASPQSDYWGPEHRIITDKHKEWLSAVLNGDADIDHSWETWKQYFMDETSTASVVVGESAFKNAFASSTTKTTNEEVTNNVVRSLFLTGGISTKAALEIATDEDKRKSNPVTSLETFETSTFFDMQVETVIQYMKTRAVNRANRTENILVYPSKDLKEDAATLEKRYQVQQAVATEADSISNFDTFYPTPSYRMVVLSKWLYKDLYLSNAKNLGGVTNEKILEFFQSSFCANPNKSLKIDPYDSLKNVSLE